MPLSVPPLGYNYRLRAIPLNLFIAHFVLWQIVFCFDLFQQVDKYYFFYSDIIACIDCMYAMVVGIGID